MSSARKFALLLVDLAALYAALAAAILARYGAEEFPRRFADHVMPFSVLFAIWLLVLYVFDLYRQKSLVNFNALANRIIAATGTAFLASIVVFYLFEPFFELTPRTNLVLFAVFFAIIDYALRVSFRKAAGARPNPAILIGASAHMEEMASFLEHNPHAGYRVADRIPALDATELAALPERVRKAEAAAVIVESGLAQDPRIVRALYRLLPLGVTIFNFADFYELLFERVPLDDLKELWFLQHVVSRRPVYDVAKRFIDIVLALAALIALSPLAFLLFALIPLTSPGPAVFGQKRVGKNDRVFTLYKFRSMTTIAGGMDGTPAWTADHDPRITRFGRFLRATHLDEIPQLWNILKGDISFTGPRPERVELASQYAAFPYYEIRHVIQPGLTGWAQINYRPSASLEEARTKLAYDIYYVKNRSFLLDLAILLKTIKYFFTQAG